MKPYFIPLIAVMATNLSFSQQAQISDSLIIDTAVDIVEVGVDRTVTFDKINNSPAAVSITNAGGSYTGTDVNFSVDQIDAGGLYGIRLNYGKSINLKTSGEDVWNTITVVSGTSPVYGISLANASERSYVSNTEINVTGKGSAHGIYSGGHDLELDNVNIQLSRDNGGLGYGILAHNARVTNEGKGQVSIISAVTGGGTGTYGNSVAIQAQFGSTVDLHDATIFAAKTRLAVGVLTVSYGSSISLKKSSIASTDGNVLVSDGSAATDTTNFVSLDNVDLAAAKNQVVTYLNTLELALSNGTDFDGYMQQTTDGRGSLNLDIISGSSWHVTQSSTLGVMGSLVLDGTSAIMFDQVSPGLFTQITSPLIEMDSGAELMLGINAGSLQALMDANGGTYDVRLFWTDLAFSNEGVVLMTSDGQELEYTTDNMGRYTLRAITAVIPEPTTSTLWLAAVGLLALRRRK